MTTVTKHCFTVVEYHKMAEVGIFGEDERVELVEGEIVDMTPIGRRHAASVARLTEIFGERLRGKAIVWPQNPIRLDENSEPQPDLVLLSRRSDFYATADPALEDVLLVVEVADTPFAYDRDVKVPLYARAGIPEVWLADLDGECLTVYRDPGPEGYRSVFTAQGADRLRPQAFPELTNTADEILARGL